MGKWIIGGKSYTNRELNELKSGLCFILLKRFCEFAEKGAKPTREMLLSQLTGGPDEDLVSFLADEILPAEFK